MLRDQVPQYLFACRFQHHLHQVRQLRREAREPPHLAQNVPHIDAEHLSVLKFVQAILPAGPRQCSAKLRGQLLPALGFTQRVDIPHHREKVLILHAQEVVPQKFGDTKQACQGVEHLGPLQRGQFIRPGRAAEQLSQVLMEV